MNEIWNIAEPYILAILGALGGGSIIYIIARVLIGQFINKASAVYDIKAIANQVADKLGGKTIDIDITSIVEKRLNEISAKLSDEVGKVAEETNSYKHLLALIGGALTHLKMLSDKEREELTKAINELDSSFVPPEKEIIATVKLEPIPTVEQPAESTAADTVNFG